MSYFKFSIAIIAAIVCCYIGAFGIFSIYTGHLIDNYGYLFGQEYNFNILFIFSIIGLILFYYAFDVIKQSDDRRLLAIVGLVLIISPLVFRYANSLPEADHVYKTALENYSGTFSTFQKVNQDKIRQHRDYIEYKNQLDNVDKLRDGRDTYAAVLNERYKKYKDYSKDSFKANPYVYGDDYNNFVLRYKGIDDEKLQEKLYDITKSGVVSYIDMVEFQRDFVNDFKNKQ